MHDAPSLRIEQLELRNFRCFEHKVIDLNYPLVLIEGDNGVGKSSIVEALYYACFMRSLRTHLPRELIRSGADYFFIQVQCRKILQATEFKHQVSVGFEQNKKLVKIDQKIIYSFKELMELYKVITITEDDLFILKGSPESRRSFIDQFLLIVDPDYAHHLRTLRTIADNRSACIRQGKNSGPLYEILTKQLWDASYVVQQRRVEILTQLDNEIQKVAKIFNSAISIGFTYVSKKKLLADYEQFIAHNPNLGAQELIMQRSLFGAQLDDIWVDFNESITRIFASRGQLKLTIMLIKLAQVFYLQTMGQSAILILDDFMTDFDSYYAQQLLELLISTKNQLIFTAPTGLSSFISLLKDRACHHVKITG